MMNEIDLNQIFSELIKTVGEKLLFFGYSRRGQVFRVMAQNCAGIIGFQRSVASSKSTIKFTINLAVVCGDLLDPAIELKKAQVYDAHVSQRIGHLLPEESDKWWELNAETDFRLLCQEIMDVVTKYAVPFVNKFLDAHAICSLWESGQSPGMTELQRIKMLQKLQSKLSDHS